MKRYIPIILLLFTFHVLSQERKNLSFINYSTDQGLSSNEGKTIVQDDLGFIWVGTDDGLNRFDGYSFKTYRKWDINPLRTFTS